MNYFGNTIHFIIEKEKHATILRADIIFSHNMKFSQPTEHKNVQ